MNKLQIIALALGLSATSSAAAWADQYFTANFTFGVFGGDANQQPPFAGVVAAYPAGGTFTGSLVHDQNLVPGAGTSRRSRLSRSWAAATPRRTCTTRARNSKRRLLVARSDRRTSRSQTN
jgi:hypothetical protein